MKHSDLLLGGRSAIIFVLMFMAILSGGYGRILSNPGDSLFVLVSMSQRTADTLLSDGILLQIDTTVLRVMYKTAPSSLSLSVPLTLTQWVTIEHRFGCWLTMPAQYVFMSKCRLC